MKTVVLMRHADAYPSDFSGFEPDRSVSVTGLLQIEQVRTAGHAIWQEIDFILCSSLKRAKQTFQAIYSVVSPNTKVMFDDHLHQATSHELLDKIQWTPSFYNHLLIIGHNPGLSQFMDAIDSGSKILETCEAVILQADVPVWQDVEFNRLQIVKRMKPSATDLDQAG